MEITLTERLPLRLRQRLDPAKKYLAAVSGGADSLALAEALLHSGLCFAVCHVEHGIRGAASLADARFVEDFCRERQIPFYLRRVQASALSRERKLSLEDAARQLRYEALLQCAEEIRADFVLTAHQKDDQAETFLLRLLRGAGTRGLGAIRFRRGRILRPLLEFTGAELRAYCRKQGLIWREDATNEELRYTRNRVRRLLLPLLKREFSPAVTELLCRTAEHLQADADYLTEAAFTEFQRRLLPGDSAVLQAEGWAQLHPALRFRILQQFWESTGGKRELSGKNLRDMSLLAERGSSGKKILLPGSWQLMYAYGKLILLPPEKPGVFLCCSGAKDTGDSPCCPLWANPSSGTGKGPDAVGFFCRSVFWKEIPEEEMLEIPLPEGHRVQLRLCREKPSYSYRQQAIYPLAKAREFGEALVFRCRQPGDRIRPLKGTGHKSLKRFFIDWKIPREQRDRQAVIAAGSEVLWLPGLANAGWGNQGMGEKGLIQPEGWLFMNFI